MMAPIGDREFDSALAWQLCADCVEKALFAYDSKFSGPLVRLSRCEVSDHINYRKNNRWRSHQFYKASQRPKLPCATLARFSELYDFRVFQHSPPIPATHELDRCLCKVVLVND